MRRRLLLVTPGPPAFEQRHGGARVVHGLANELVRRHDVVLLHLAGGPPDPDIIERCRAVHVVTPPDPGPWGVRARGAVGVAQGRSLRALAAAVPELRREVAALCRDPGFDVVQVETGILGDALAGARGAHRVLTVYEPAASQGESARLRRDGLPGVHRLDARVALREERRLLRRADAVVTFTERDRRLLPVPQERCVTIPLGWDVPAQACDPVGTPPPTLLFVGNFVHPPNVHAARTLAHEVFPRVRARHPGARLELVGAAPPPELQELACEDVVVTGEVPSIVPHLERAAVVVVPIALGGGMRVKVLEALAAGKAVVASPRAAEGVTAPLGEALVVADGAAATADSVVGLLADEERRRELAGGARAWALRELRWATMADRYDELYARLERDGARG